MRKGVGDKSADGTRRAICLAFANHKGGTGKTTSCISIAGYLAKNKRSVLVVDCDPQANATSGLGIDKSSVRASSYDFILHACDGQEGLPITRVILETGVASLHIAPAEFDLAVAELVMARARERSLVLRRALEPIRPHYDFILLDLPPTSGLLTLNGLCAADEVLVPVDPSVYALETLDDLEESFAQIKEATGHVVRQRGAVLIRYVPSNGRKRGPSQEVEVALKKRFTDVFVVPTDETVYQTQKAGVPISHFAPQSAAGKAYAAVAQALLGTKPRRVAATPRKRSHG